MSTYYPTVGGLDVSEAILLTQPQAGRLGSLNRLMARGGDTVSDVEFGVVGDGLEEALGLGGRPLAEQLVEELGAVAIHL